MQAWPNWHYWFTQSRLGWWAAILVVLAVLAGIMQFERRYDSAVRVVNSEHLNLLALGNAEFNRQLGDIRNSTRLLDSHLYDLLEKDNAPLALQVFQRVGGILPNLSQLRWMNLNGDEVVRVDFPANGGPPHSQTRLQNKEHRPYFQIMKNTLPGALILSGINLNMEQGKIITPFEPTIRAMLHTTTAHPLGEGFLILNFRLTELFDFIRDLRSINTQLLLADDQPQWIVHHDQDREWTGRIHGPTADIPDFWQRLNANRAVASYVAQNQEVYSASPLQLSLSEQAEHHQTLYFVARTPASFIIQQRRAALLPAALTTLFILLMGGILLYREAVMSSRVNALNVKLQQGKAEVEEALEHQQRLQAELVETEKMASLGMLVAGIAHELNTPLGAAIMSISGLQNRLHDLKQQIEAGLKKSSLDSFIKQTDDATKLAISNLQRASALIKRFKRLSIDRSSEQVTHFHLRQNVTDLVNAMQPQLKKYPLDIHIDISKGIYLTSYPGTLSQVIQNLINNSLHHAFLPDQQGRITIRAHSSQNHVILAIEDTGNGIEPSVAGSLFDPFVTSGRHQGNSGLGLHLVHQWVTQVLEGSIAVHSEPNQGTTFTLTLPTHVSNPESAPQRQAG